MNQQLVLWEPLENNPFCDVDNQLHFYGVDYGQDFMLAFEEANQSDLTIFTYKIRPQDLAIMSFNFHPSMMRSDIHALINDYLENHESSYQPTFYKVAHSDWIAWYDHVFPARVELNPQAEYHLYITSDLYIEVMSETEPHVRIIKKEQWAQIRA